MGRMTRPWPHPRPLAAGARPHALPALVLRVVGIAWLAGAAGPRTPAAQPENAASPIPTAAAPTGPRATLPPGAGGMRPDAAGRIVRVFDFEEFTPNPVPDYWVRAQDEYERPALDGRKPTRVRAGFPRDNQAVFDDTVSRGGSRSVRLPTKGGSASLQLSPGVIPVFGDTDYRISAAVRTSGLRHARAALRARVLDNAGEPIPGSERTSELVLSEERWTEVAVEVLGQGGQAAFLQIELLLLQPRQAMTPRSAPHQVWLEDFGGSAWFDDIVVMQMARVEVSSDATSNVVVRPQTPELKLLVRDLTGSKLVARLTLTDVDGRVVDVSEQELSAGLATTTWKPRVAELGWYHARLEVLEDGVRVGAAETEMVYLPETRGTSSPGRVRSTDGSRLGVALRETPEGWVDQLAPTVVRLGAGAVSIPIWSQGLTRDGAATLAKGLGPALEALSADWCDVGLTLAEVPADLTDGSRLDRDDIWTALRQPRTVWGPYLEPFMERFGPSVRRWQIGRDSSRRPADRTDLTGDLDQAYAALSGLVTAPIVTVGADAELRLGPRAVATERRPGAVSALVPADLTPIGVHQLARAWRESDRTGLETQYEAVLELGDAATLGARACVEEFVKKAVELWAGASDPAAGSADATIRASVAQPWRWSGGRRPALLPRPEFAAWRNVVDRLTDRVVVGEFPVTPGVRALILAPSRGGAWNRGGAIVAWNDSATPEDAVLRLHPGEGAPAVLDLFGNAKPAETDPASPGGIRVALSGSPVFLEGIDVDLARLQASLRLEPPMLRSDSQRQDARIVFENPWGVQLSGQITILEPGGFDAATGTRDRSWKILPRTQRFVLGPGERAGLPIAVGFSAIEETGSRDFVFELTASAAREYGPLRVRTPVALGLEELGLQVSCAADPTPEGPDIVVEAQVTNLSAQSMNLEVTAFAPSQPRARSVVGELAPGDSVLRRFVFRGAASTLKGQRIVVSLSNPETGARLNRGVVAP